MAATAAAARAAAAMAGARAAGAKAMEVVVREARMVGLAAGSGRAACACVVDVHEDYGHERPFDDHVYVGACAGVAQAGPVIARQPMWWIASSREPARKSFARSAGVAEGRRGPE